MHKRTITTFLLPVLPVLIWGPRANLATTFEVKDHRGHPTLHVDGRPVYPFMYLMHLGDRQRLHRQFASTGAHFHSFACPLGFTGPGKFDTGAVDRAFESIRSADPQGYLLPRISVTAPRWWQEAHPDQCVVFDDGRTGPNSFASRTWRADLGEHLERFVRHVRAQPYGDRVIGFHICSGVTAEWQSWGLWSDRRGDFSRPALETWRTWLRDLYATDKALQRAWRQPKVTLASAPIPTRARRENDSERLFRRPADWQDVIDFYRFYPQMVADSILELATRCKNACDRKALVGVFHGYAVQYAGKAQESQHLALDRILHSPDIDFLCSPALYTLREPGGTSTFMSATGSVNLHGKMWFHEADNRTHRIKNAEGIGRVAPAGNLLESRGVLQREFGHCIQRAAALWWFDMEGGWYDDPAILADFQQMNALAPTLCIEEEDLLPAPRIAVLHGYKAYPRMQPNADFLHHAITIQVASLPKVGAVSELYRLPDLPNVPPARVHVFLNCADLSDADRENIAALRRDGNTLVFLHAAGLGRFDDRRNAVEDVRAMSNLMGIAVDISETALPPRADFTDAYPFAGQPGHPKAFGYRHPVSPVLHCVDADAEVWAQYTAGGRAAVAYKRFENHAVLWAGAVPVPPGLLRNIADQAGVHVYSRSGDALYAGHNLITLHAATAGPKRITLPGDFAVEPLYGAPMPRREGRSLLFDAKKSQTRSFRIRPAGK